VKYGNEMYLKIFGIPYSLCRTLCNGLHSGCYYIATLAGSEMILEKIFDCPGKVREFLSAKVRTLFRESTVKSAQL